MHRDRSGDAEPGGGTVLQQARDGGAMDQGRQAGGEDDTAELSSNPVEEVRLWLSLIAYNLGNLRRLVLPKRIETWSSISLQQRLAKTGGRLIKHARYHWLLLAENQLTWHLFGSMLRRLEALPLPAE
jgi:hypothetical protein